METMARFFDYINNLLGVTTPMELVFHPVFIGICVAALIYSIVKQWKFFSLGITGLMGGAATYYYLFPKEGSDLGELITFVAAVLGLALVLIYLGFVRE
jgi:hypothetical protein